MLNIQTWLNILSRVKYKGFCVAITFPSILAHPLAHHDSALKYWLWRSTWRGSNVFQVLCRLQMHAVPDLKSIGKVPRPCALIAVAVCCRVQWNSFICCAHACSTPNPYVLGKSHQSSMLHWWCYNRKCVVLGKLGPPPSLGTVFLLDVRVIFTPINFTCDRVRWSVRPRKTPLVCFI